MVAWHAGLVCSFAHSRRANNTRHNLQTVIQQQQSNRQLWWTGRQAGMDVLKEEFPQAWHGRGRNEYRRDRRGGRSGGRINDQRRSRPRDSRRVVSTPGGWSRGPAGHAVIINSRQRSGSGSGCSSERPSGDAARRLQGSWRHRAASCRRRQV